MGYFGYHKIIIIEEKNDVVAKYSCHETGMHFTAGIPVLPDTMEIYSLIPLNLALYRHQNYNSLNAMMDF